MCPSALLRLGLPDPTTCTDAHAFVRALYAMEVHVLRGVSELSPTEMLELAEHTMIQDFWDWTRREYN